MRKFRALVRSLVVGLIIYGCFRVFAEQQQTRICQLEATKLEQKLEELIEANPTEVCVKQLQVDEASSSWLVHVPPGRSVEFVLDSPGSAETVLIQAPAQRSAQRGIIQIEFPREDANDVVFPQLVLYALDFNQVSRQARAPAHFTDVTFWTEPVTTDAFGRIALLLSSRAQYRNYMTQRDADRNSIEFCRQDEALVLCRFLEEVLTAKKLQQNEFILNLRAK